MQRMANGKVHGWQLFQGAGVAGVGRGGGGVARWEWWGKGKVVVVWSETMQSKPVYAMSECPAVAPGSICCQQMKQ